MPVPETGAIATTRTTIPIPPRYCIRLRHQKTASGWLKSSSSVAPVVVNPLIASKKASIGLLKVPASSNGIAPAIAAASQASVTAANPR